MADAAVAAEQIDRLSACDLHARPSVPAQYAAARAAPGALAAIRDDNRIDSAHFAQALGRLANSDPVADALDGAFIDASGVVGTADECLAQMQALGQAGLTQVTVTMIGDQPQARSKQLGAALCA